jgi:FtsP/CotA-like multicopper oxidase with cupredoxin domain
MRASTHTRARRSATLAAIVLIAATVGNPASAPSAPQVRTIDLCAKPGNTTLPGGASVPIWGFALKPAGVDCTDAAVGATLPGPRLEVGVGDTVTLNVTNALGAGRTLSLEAPGIDFDAGPVDAAAGATVTRTFTASSAGTYGYASSGGAGRQAAMGLYGALIVRPQTAGQAYGDAASAYDAEQTMVLSEIDPALNTSPDPDTFDMLGWAPTYWLINGSAHPDLGPIDAHAGDRVLLRYVNAGLEHVTMTMLGIDSRVLARDAYRMDNPLDLVAQTVPAGATSDGIVTVPGSASPGDRFPIYNRQLHLTNGAQHTAGGMLTFIRVVP